MAAGGPERTLKAGRGSDGDSTLGWPDPPHTKGTGGLSGKVQVKN